MLRCAQLYLSDAALDTMTMGMVYDILIEQGNDNEEYDLCPEPGSMKSFFSGGGING